MSQITTHILDTSLGKPAQGVSVNLYQQQNSEWQKLAQGITNADGRITDLLPIEMKLVFGIYKIRFEVQPYFDTSFITSFYPFVEIVFHVNSEEHYHIPLLLNPFGYSTYRGS